MILFRNVLKNTQSENIDWLFDGLMKEIGARDPWFGMGAVGISRHDAIYMALHPKPKIGGQQIMISMFAYGDSASLCFGNMMTVVDAVHGSLPTVNQLARRAARLGRPLK